MKTLNPVNAVNRVRLLAGHAAFVVLLSAACSLPIGSAASAQEPAPDTQDPAAGLLKQAQQDIREGRLEAALSLDRQALAAAPDSFQAHSQTGAVLDLLARYDEARQHLTRAIALAPSPEVKARALRAMAVSYGFQNDCAGATRYAQPAYDIYLGAKDDYNAGEAADEMARLCIESGDFDAAETWYRTGHDAGLKEPGIRPERVDLWNFRLEHALARLAARRGHAAEAQRHVEAARTILDKGTNPEQKAFLPYLTGYVALFTGEYRTALGDLQQANQSDPFILCLIAQTYEKLGEQAQATEYYRKALARAVTHNPPTAYARPLAEKKLGGAQ